MQKLREQIRKIIKETSIADRFHKTIQRYQDKITKENINSYFEKALKQLDQIECNLDNKTLLKEYFEKIMVRVS